MPCGFPRRASKGQGRRFASQRGHRVLAPIPTSHNSGAATSAARIFHTQDGSQVILVLNGKSLLDSFAVQVTDR